MLQVTDRSTKETPLLDVTPESADWEKVGNDAGLFIFTDSEILCTISYMTMQSGMTDVVVVWSPVDSPQKVHHGFCSNEPEELVKYVNRVLWGWQAGGGHA